MKKRRIDKWFPAMAVLLCGAAIVLIIRFITVGSWSSYHSDCTDTLYWAKAAYDDHRLISRHFYYAALLPYGGSLFMLPFIGITGFSPVTHVIGMLIFLGLLVFSLGVAFKQSRFSLAACLLGITLFLGAVSGSQKIREIFWQHVIYYSLGVLQFLLVFAAYMRADRETLKPELSKKKVVFALLPLFLASMWAGANGMQITVLAVFPACFSLVMEVFCDREPLLAKKRLREGGLLLIMVSGTIAGLLLYYITTKGVSAGYAEAYSSYSLPTEFWKNLGKLPEQWFSLVGVEVKKGTSLFSGVSILVMIRIFLALASFILPWVIVAGLKREKSIAVKRMAFCHVGMSAFILYGYIFGKLSAGNWRLIPMYATGIILILFWIFTRTGRMKRIAAATGLALFFAGTINLVTMPLSDKNKLENNSFYQLAEFLEENHLSKGGATFWNSQKLTVFSADAVTCVNVDFSEAKGLYLSSYQYDINWKKEIDTDPCFILLSAAEVTKVKNSPSAKVLEKAVKTYKWEKMTIYVFSSWPL